ncbi:MAG TPA: hydrogenase maturation protease, partial [bacterium]|nr:hydrogenase maturation protease [bacterium]
MLVIGVGNPYRRDDAAGLIAARRLGAAAPGLVLVREESGEGAALLEAWEGADAVIVLDAVCSGAPPGTIRRIDAHRETIPTEVFHSSTHAFNVAEAIELARVLRRLPRRLIVFGVEGAHFDAGLGLSPPVERAVERLVKCGLEELHHTGG